MRFDTMVHFQKICKGSYDKNTGNHTEDTVLEFPVPASVTNAGTEMLQMVYGQIPENSRVVRIQGKRPKGEKRIRIDDKVYRIDFHREQRNIQVFVVSEVP